MAQEQELTLEEALAKLKDQAAHIEKLEGEAGESTGLISELTEKLSNAEAGQELNPVVVLTHKQKQYRVIGTQFRHQGKEYKAEDLKTNSDLVAALLEAGSELLQLVKKPAAAKATKEEATK